MKRTWITLSLCIILVLTSGCGGKIIYHTTGQTNGSTSVTQSYIDESSTSKSNDTSITDGTSSESDINSDEPSDDYPYDIAADRAKFHDLKIDIVVGDKLYMTQINDWYTNFQDYNGKAVEIEGYYMAFGNYIFVGRKGPTCPYCTGGYVNFEFQTDEDLSSYVSESTWVKVTGILRKGTMYPGSGQAAQPFYYIEAMDVEKLDKIGVDTVKD